MTGIVGGRRTFRPAIVGRRVTLVRVLPALVVVGASLVFASPVSAGGYSLRLSGPSSNPMGTDFNYLITGTAGGSANHVVAWEQFNKVNGCAPTFAAESVRAVFDPTSLYELTAWTNEAVSGSYSVTAAFGAAHLGVHGVCAYLINFTTGQTYAHAGAFWTNVNS